MILDKTSDEFGTPAYIFEPLQEEFCFGWDAAASKDNALLGPDRCWTKEQDALKQDWSGKRIFCNPPYSGSNVKNFITKAYEETRKDCLLAVLLVPTRTEQAWFHDIALKYAEVRFIRKRIKFIGGATTARDSHMLVIFRNWRWIR